jgi:recombination protein RecA
MKKKKVVRKPYVSIDSIAEAVASVLGSEDVYKAHNSDQGTPKMFIPSGVPDLDFVLDRKGRGWPTGRVVEIYGGEATCKSGIGYALIAEAQKLGGNALLYPAEGNYDEWLAEQYGVDFERLVLGDNETIEKIFGSFSKAMRKSSDNILIGMIDSIAGSSTQAELDEFEETGIIKRDRSAQIRALQLSNALRKIGASIPRTNSILFCVNQIRENPDAMLFQKKTKPPGGRALKFYASIRLELEAIKKVKRTVKGKQVVAGFDLRITAVKNRLARPYQEAEIYLDYEKGLLPKRKPKKKKVGRKKT